MSSDDGSGESWLDQIEPAGTSSNTNGDESERTSVEDVEERVIEHFDAQTWDVIEVILSAHATHLIEGTNRCFGLVVEGPSGAGKTTCLRPFIGLDSQFYRSDDFTPASLVSQDSSRTDEELEEQDLLPRICYKTVLNPDMANWFAGDWAERSKKMQVLVRVMDGEGYVRDAGTHGRRGYEGDFPFNFIGATTPLDRQAWKLMGHTGNRFLFHEMTSTDDEEADLKAVFGAYEYEQKVQEIREVVHAFLEELWQTYGGVNGADCSNQPSRALQERISYFANLIRHARAPIHDDGKAEFEGRKRGMGMLHDLARGHALINGRQELQKDDLQVCARTALSTMPRERRPLVRELLRSNGSLRTQDV